MKNSIDWKKESSEWSIKLTNWTKNDDDPKVVYWSQSGSEMTLNSKLETSHRFDKMFVY